MDEDSLPPGSASPPRALASPPLVTVKMERRPSAPSPVTLSPREVATSTLLQPRANGQYSYIPSLVLR
jgi:hypothetical protein